MVKNIVRMSESTIRMSVHVHDYLVDEFLPVRADRPHPCGCRLGPVGAGPSAQMGPRVCADEDTRRANTDLGYKRGRGKYIRGSLSLFFLTSNHSWLNSWKFKRCVYTWFFPNWITGLLVGNPL
jgi:hypothetical protein